MTEADWDHITGLVFMVICFAMNAFMWWLIWRGR